MTDLDIDLSEIEKDDPNYYKAQSGADLATRAANRLILAERRRKVAKLVHARMPQFEIARLMKVSLKVISEDVRWLRAQWKAEALEDIEEQTTRELTELAVWEAKLAELFIKTKNGNYMDRILKIKEQRAKLLGLYKPTKIAPTNPEGTAAYEALSDEEIDARIADVLSKLTGSSNS